MLAISVDTPEESATLKRELGLHFPLLSDADEKVIAQYGLVHKNGHGDHDISRPADIFVDKDGVIRWARFTDNFRVRPHPDEILAAVTQAK